MMMNMEKCIILKMDGVSVSKIWFSFGRKVGNFSRELYHFRSSWMVRNIWGQDYVPIAAFAIIRLSVQEW